MKRVLPGVALLLLLGGAGLGFAYATLENLGGSLALLAGEGRDPPPMLDDLNRLRGVLDLLVFAWGAGFGLLGVGWLLDRPSAQPPAWEQRLATLIRDTHDARREALQPLEGLMASQMAQLNQLQGHVDRLASHLERQESQPAPQPAPLSPLALLSAPSPLVPDPTTARPPAHPRLALPAQATTHDKQDEEFEPF